MRNSVSFLLFQAKSATRIDRTSAVKYLSLRDPPQAKNPAKAGFLSVSLDCTF